MAGRLYTRGGDGGETGLYGGQRVSKAAVRVEAYGAVDELNAALGHVRAARPPEPLSSEIAWLQGLLFEVGAELATPPGRGRRPRKLVASDVERMEALIDELDDDLPALGHFVLPGGGEVGSRLHLARTSCRRAERRVVALIEQEGGTEPLVVAILNRLGDLLFVMARWANRNEGCTEEAWRPRGG